MWQLPTLGGLMETSCISDQAEAYTYYVPRPMKTGKVSKFENEASPPPPPRSGQFLSISAPPSLAQLVHRLRRHEHWTTRGTRPQCHPVVSYDLVKISSPASVFARPIVIRIMRSFNTSDSVATGPAAIQIGAFVRLIVRAEPRRATLHGTCSSFCRLSDLLQ